jgi:hypothetical protein
MLALSANITNTGSLTPERNFVMVVYKRRKGKDTWHWCRNCSNYPTGSDVETRYTRPTTGELCNECKSKEKAGNCSS